MEAISKAEWCTAVSVDVAMCVQRWHLDCSQNDAASTRAQAFAGDLRELLEHFPQVDCDTASLEVLAELVS